MAHPRHISSQTILELQDGWSIYLTAPDSIAHPSELAGITGAPLPGTAPGTVVSALEKAGSAALAFQSPDDFDIWYECCFEADVPAAPGLTHLVFEGLATIADVWLNGEWILRSENMYLRHEINITGSLRSHNALLIRFSSLNRFLEQRRPRPRWRTHLVDHTQLRWVRTTLVGRMPGWHEWAKCLHAVGPWRPISLVYERGVQVKSSDIKATLEGRTGLVEAQIGLHLLAGELSEAALMVGDEKTSLKVSNQEDGSVLLSGTARIPDAALWWPHTHGAQPLYSVRVSLTVDGLPVEVDFGRTGFRSLAADTQNGGFSLSINGEKVFLRGACWTGADAANLTGEAEDYERLLAMVREAGMNMLRIPGTGFYESDTFYDLCAELGITLWQDFSFALMDYPGADSVFCESVAAEAGQLLRRLQSNPALAVLCGNSECEAAGAMHGLSAEQWANPLFEDLLPQAARRTCPQAAYIRSSQWGGAWPFQVDTGVSHYYGLGAYLRPPEDVRRSRVRFAAECLGFSNIPEDETIHTFLAEGESPGHHPSWNAGIPRNVGLGWDFGDVRSHYTQVLFGEDLSRARYSDPERYLALGRIVNGELMASAFAEWRRSDSTCGGALVWFLRDLWPGAGWGIVDSFDRPKSVFYYLKRALAPCTLFFSDEGMSGLRLHVVNERPEALTTTLRIAFFRHGRTCTREMRVPLCVQSRGSLELNMEELAGHFLDTTYAYRFGPPGHDVIFAAFDSESAGRPSPSAFYFPGGLKFPPSADLGLQAQACPGESGQYILTLRTEQFAQAIHIEVGGFQADDNYFHLEPGGERTVALSPIRPPGETIAGTVKAFNAFAPAKIRFGENASCREASLR